MDCTTKLSTSKETTLLVRPVFHQRKGDFIRGSTTVHVFHIKHTIFQKIYPEVNSSQILTAFLKTKAEKYVIYSSNFQIILKACFKKNLTDLNYLSTKVIVWPMYCVLDKLNSALSL